MANEFNKTVSTRYHMYNSLFLNLPYSGIYRTGTLLPLLQQACETGYEKGKDPRTIIKKFFSDFTPQAGAAGWSISTAQVFNMVALKASLEIIDRAGIEHLRLKSIRLTGYLEYLLKQLKHLNFEIITPVNPAERGAQLSLYFRERGREIFEELVKKGVVVDYREPGVIRVAPAPLYNSYEDVFRFYEILRDLK